METNERTTNKNYEEAQEWAVSPDIHAVLAKNWDDEKRHLAYLQSHLGVRV
jgi:rubrerythrin